MLGLRANLSAGLRAPCLTRQAVGAARPMRLATVICPSTKLYVGNLSWDTQKEDLEDLFGKYGNVEDVFVVVDRETGRHRGFGFVTMEDGAESAIENTNEMEFMGRNIRVNEALPPGERTEGGRGYGRGGRGGGRGYGGDRDSGRSYGAGRGYGGEERRGGRGYGRGGRGGGGYGRQESNEGGDY